MIAVPDNIPVTEWPASVTWTDESGIFYVVYKKGPQRSLQEIMDTMGKFRESLDGKLVCVLADVTNSSQPSREVREFAAMELPRFIRAIAMVSDSALGKMLANLFLTLKAQPYPTRMFRTETEAKEWLKKFL
jgi:hypothetical protein